MKEDPLGRQWTRPGPLGRRSLVAAGGCPCRSLWPMPGDSSRDDERRLLSPMLDELPRSAEPSWTCSEV